MVEPIRILDIGNSFSRNATYYLHDILAAYGIDASVVNLYVGGCSLARHWVHYTQGLDAYEIDVDGVATRTLTSIPVQLQQRWDHIVTQQVSHDSGILESYEPYLGNLLEMLRVTQPQAQYWLQETWAYEWGCTNLKFSRYGNNPEQMYSALSDCYHTVSTVNHVPMILAGEVIQQARQLPQFAIRQGGESLSEPDGVHLAAPYGRYCLGMAWATTMFDLPIDDRYYPPEVITPEDKRMIRILNAIIRGVCQ